MLGAFLWGTLIGSAMGFLLGLTTADPDAPWQARIRERVQQVYREAREAAEAEERALEEEYRRLTGME